MNNTALHRTLIAALFASLALGGLLTLARTYRPALAEIDAAAQSTQIAPQTSSPGTICFVVDDSTSCVDRPTLRAGGTITDQVRTLIQAVINGPTPLERAMGVNSSLPADAQLLDVHASIDRTSIRLELPQDFLDAFEDGDAEDINTQLATTLTPFNFNRIDVEVRDPSDADVFRPLSSFLAPITIPVKPDEQDTVRRSEPPIHGQPQSSGALSNKTVFVSAGHGWYWSTNVNQFRTQRPHYPTSPYPSGNGIIEDFHNAEAVNQYLLTYLWNAGADAWSVRERDMNTSMQIIDNTSSGFSTQGSWASDAMVGYGGSYRYATSVTGNATATATWSFTTASSAEYAVYVWYPVTSGRAPAVHYFVEHAGGTTEVTISQQQDAINWRYLGTYPFKAGQTARVRLNNQSTVAGKVVMADAIRVGGGTASITLPEAPGPSGKPRWEEQSKQYAMWINLPDAATHSDVVVRPIYSEWESESGEDSIYIAWHTNGFNGYNTTERGTETYIHSFEPTPLSDRLQFWVHNELIGDIHKGWEPTWPDRGLKSQDLGELRLLESMPGILIENGFHDHLQDVEAIKDPRFNQLSARAIYQGIVRYWHEQDPANVPLVFLPEPPTHVTVRNTGPNQITVGWQPGPTDSVGLLGNMAASYRVYTSTDGFGWGDAIIAPSTSLVLNDLPSGQVIYVRVTGINAGGESFPTPVLAARTTPVGVAPVLLAYGFERIDRLGLIQQNDSPVGVSRRMFLDRINRFDYIIQHAEAITYPFDSASHAAVSFERIDLKDYNLVDWIAGEEQSPDVVLNSSDQSLLQSYLFNGGALLVSGAEIGFDLAGNGLGTPFYNDILHANYVADDAATYSAAPVAGGIFSNLGTVSFDDGTHGTYDVDSPDVFNPQGGAQSALVYNGGLGGRAALTFANGSCTRLVYMGFPIESIYPEATRRAVFGRAIDFLDPCVPPNIPDTVITSPSDIAAYRFMPSFNGTAQSRQGINSVQVALISGTLFYNGSTFVPAETWLNASGTTSWSYAPPSLTDGTYQLRSRAIAPGPVIDNSPATANFTLDFIPPSTPFPLAPVGDVALHASVATFSWGPSDGATGFEFELDGRLEFLYSADRIYTRSIGEGSHQWRVRAFDFAGNRSSWSVLSTFSSIARKEFLPFVSKNAESVPTPQWICSELITNGGFENGLTGWNTPANNPSPVLDDNLMFGGTHSVRVGSAGSQASGFSSVQQSLTIPVDAALVTLSFARYRESGDALNDLQYVATLNGNSVLEYLVLEHVHDPVWSKATFDLSSYAGQTINLRFSVKNDGTGSITRMFVDNVSVQACTPEG